MNWLSQILPLSPKEWFSNHRCELAEFQALDTRGRADHLRPTGTIGFNIKKKKITIEHMTVHGGKTSNYSTVGPYFFL